MEIRLALRKDQSIESSGRGCDGDRPRHCAALPLLDASPLTIFLTMTIAIFRGDH